VLDMQHGFWDLAGMLAAVSAIHNGGAAPIVRPPLNDVATASRALDFGAEGIIAPMINSAADARTLAAATKYPPLGERSWGPPRALTLGGYTDAGSYLQGANEATVTFAMIETRAALDNVEAIIGTDGIDALFLGPSDLSIALSNGATINHFLPEVERAIDRIAEAAFKAGKVAGAFCADADRALALAKRGYRFLTVGNDLGSLRSGTAAHLAALKSA
jgi:4-hydroxy-2-oxoheptanedioate aldolase